MHAIQGFALRAFEGIKVVEISVLEDDKAAYDLTLSYLYSLKWKCSFQEVQAISLLFLCPYAMLCEIG